ncbi:MAG: hypothetical protein JSW55_11415 [Chloroflexota bacterium]|nr:MAG: hypothetical protein JSW55_11415 [Chloroflexota bacterium]
MSKHTIKVVIVVLMVSLLAARSAWAGPYIDPNTGGMLFQMLAVAFGLLSGVVLLFSSRIKMLLARIMRSFRERKEVQEPGAPPEQE